MNSRRLPLLIGLLGLLGLGGAIVLNWKSLRMEWYRRQAIQDATAEGSEADLNQLSIKHTEGFAPCWKSLVDGGDEGFGALVRLLLHRDARVWAHAVVTIDYAMPSKEAVSTIRKHGQLPLLRYLLPEPYQHGTDWRGPIEDLMLEKGEKWVRPETPGVQFCEDVLQGKVDVEKLGNMAWKERASDALFLMLDPGEGVRPVAGDALRCRIIDTLVALVQGGNDPELALFTVRKFFARLLLEPSESHDLLDWEGLFRLGFPRVNCAPPDQKAEAFIECPIEKFLDPIDLAILVRVDHPRVLRVLLCLEKDPKGRAALDQALAWDLPELPVPLPRWRPFRESALGYFHGPSHLRPGGALALVDLGGQDSSGAILAALKREENADMALLDQACLLMLGDDRFLPWVLTRFDLRLRELQKEIAENGSIRGWDFSGHEHFQKDGVRFQDFVAGLLRAGRREVLNSVMDCLKTGGPYKLLAPPLIEAVQSFPAWNLDRDDQSFLAWWAQNRDKIRFDSAKGLWVVPSP